MQEEEDDEDEGDREELGSPLNRRGSRSEGRINVAVQDRLADADRIKKDPKPQVVEDNRQKCELLEGIAGIKIIKNDTPKEKYLGMAGSGLNKKLTMTQRNFEIRSNSVDKQMKTVLDRKDVISTKVLTDSSTINIVPTINIVNSNQLPKFKTMPSPTRTTTLFTNPSNCLKDIFEELTDAGSSDTSNTTTPKPILKSSVLGASTSASENCPPNSGGGTSNQHHHRRTKFHKTRTTSCSSSEDEDNAENRKKRANKIIDSSKPFSHSQRRDSHDDSSDSQEQKTNKGSGNTASGGASTTLLIRCNKTSNGNSSNTNSSGTTQTHSSQNEKNRQKNCTKSSSGTDLGYHRRAGRRRPVETRLRESQSLNRITEVQECEVQSSTHIVNNRLSPMPNTSDATTDKTEDDTCDGGQELELENDEADNENENEENIKSAVQIVINEPKTLDQTDHNNSHSNPPISNHQTSTPGKTSKSFSARLFQNFKKSSSSQRQQQKQLHIPTINVTLNGSEDSSNPSSQLPESAVLADLDKKSSNHIRPSSNGTAKKIKILGRYFQVSFFDDS